jgi:MFS family permease
VNAVPTITRDFDSLKDVGWYGSAFLLTQMALQPTWGRLYTYFNSKWLFMLSIFIFEAGSVICATAPNSMVFVVGRAIAGIGGSGIFGGALAIVSQTIPLKDRPMYIGLVSCMFGVASLLGPLVGGIITDSWLTWRFCFWVNLRMLNHSTSTVKYFSNNFSFWNADNTDYNVHI